MLFVEITTYLQYEDRLLLNYHYLKLKYWFYKNNLELRINRNVEKYNTSTNSHYRTTNLQYYRYYAENQ